MADSDAADTLYDLICFGNVRSYGTVTISEPCFPKSATKKLDHSKLAKES